MSATVDDVQVTLAGPDGSSAKITLFGAHVVSFVSEFRFANAVLGTDISVQLKHKADC